jgi:hypothetical protein
MNIGEIVKDAVRYPLSDWKKILILGIIIVISGIASVVTALGATNIDLISLLVGIGFIIGFLVNGYMFRIIRSSLDGAIKLPEFEDWIDIGADGAKVFMVFIVYLVIPILAILLFAPLLLGLEFSFFELNFASILGSMGINPLNIFVDLIGSIIWHGIWNLFAISYDFFAPVGIFAIIYTIIIIPLFTVAIANMAYYEGEFRSAFRFREIFDEISSIGWGKLIMWYMVTGILFLIPFFIVNNVIIYIFSLIHISIVGGVLTSLIIAPYFYMYMARSVALYYMPD